MPIYTLKVRGPDEVLRQAADAVIDTVWPVMQVLSDGASHPWEVYLNPLRTDPGFITVEPGALHFDFHDLDGEIGFYDEVCRGWFALTVAAIPDRIVRALSPLRVHPVGIPPLQEALKAPRERVLRWGTALVEVDDQGDEVVVMSDGIYESVDEEDIPAVRAFYASGDNQDPVEGNLRPSERVRDALLSQVADATGDVLQSVAWYVGHQAFPGSLASFLLERAPDAPGPIGQAFERLGGRADIESVVEKGLGDVRSAVRVAALRAVVPLVRRGRVPRANAVDGLLAALERSEEEREVAAEALGQFDPGPKRAAVVEALCGLVNQEPEVEHSAVLALFNLHRDGGAPGPVREVFEVVARRAGPAQRLAEIAVRRL